MDNLRRIIQGVFQHGITAGHVMSLLIFGFRLVNNVMSLLIFGFRLVNNVMSLLI